MRPFAIGLCVTLCVLLALNAPTHAAEAPDAATVLAAKAAQALVDQQLHSVQGALATLATSSEVQSLDWDAMYPLLASFQEHCPPSLVWFAKPDGVYYTVRSGLIDQTLTDRTYFAPLMSGKEILGELVVGKTSGKLSAVVAVPVYKDGAVAGAIGASVFTTNMADDLAAKLGLPDGMSLLITDKAGQTVCAIPADGPQWVEAIHRVAFADGAGSFDMEIEGQQYSVAYRFAEDNGWFYLLGIKST
jgi:hypothetical protein